MITVEIPRRTLEQEIAVMRAVQAPGPAGAMFVEGVLAALDWLNAGTSRPSEHFYIRAHTDVHRAG